MKITESWANDILHWHDDIAANPAAFIGVRDAHRDAAALVRQLQTELQDARRAGLESLEALMMARDEAQGGEVEYEFEVWQNGSLQANGSTFDYPAAKSEADHYAAMHGQDGPVEVRLFMKRQITAPPSVPVGVSDRDDARRYRALVATGKYVPAMQGWGLACGHSKASKAELDAAAAADALAQPGGSDNDR